jgi:G3E family GTPase
MIPLSLVTGFLGSGKTTLLARLAERAGRTRVAFVVNEISRVDVDGPRLAARAGVVRSVTGGSIFCRCKATDFLKVLGELVGAAPQYDAVVVEASGLADPRVAPRMLADTGMDARFRLASIVTVVDPGTVARLLCTLPAVSAQIAAADRVIVNKTDLYARVKIDEAARAVRRLNPAARIDETSWCAADIDLVTGSTARGGVGEYARCPDPSFTHVVAQPSETLRLVTLVALLEDPRWGLYRAKGVVGTADGPVSIDLSPAGLTVCSPAAGEPRSLVLIGARERGDLATLVSKMEAGGARA